MTKTDIRHLFLIVVVSIIIYSNTFYVPFHFDDRTSIVDNYNLRDLSNFWPPAGLRWVGLFTFALNYYFGELNTFGYHIVNLIIHILNAILVYWFVVLTFRTPYFMVRQAHHDNAVILSMSKGHRFTDSPIHLFTYLPLFIALLFVSHPIQTQAVTYIVQRFASLATFFYLLSLVMYIKFRMQDTGYGIQDTPLNPPLARGEIKGGASCIMNRASEPKLHATRYTLYAVSLISAILAMKTKEISFTLPVVIGLYEFMFFDGKIKKKIIYLIPLLLTMLIIPLSLIDIDKPIGDAIGEIREASQETAVISRPDYLFTQFRVIVTYIRLLILPVNQNLNYDYPIFHSFFNAEVFLSFLFLLSIFCFAVYLFYRSRYNPPSPPFSKGGMGGFLRIIAFGIFWFFITLSVESSIIPIRDLIFEHRLYLPSVGIIIAFVTAVFYYNSRFMHRILRIPLTANYLLLATIVISLSIATYHRNNLWKDEIKLWEDVVVKSPYNVRSHNNLGYLYYKKGLLDKSVQEYKIALRLRPYYAIGHNNLGLIYYEHGRMDEAIGKFKTAIMLSPDYAEAHNNLGNAYNSQGRTDEAIREFETAIRLKPDYAEAHNNIGLAYMALGLIDKAIMHYQTALRLNPNLVRTHNNLGLAYKQKGLINEAMQEFQTALRLQPDFIEARENLELLQR